MIIQAAVFNGKIFVRQDAQKTNAFQQNNNLLLSDKATGKFQTAIGNFCR